MQARENYNSVVVACGPTGLAAAIAYAESATGRTELPRIAEGRAAANSIVPRRVATEG
jgi:hypothetical protein